MKMFNRAFWLIAVGAFLLLLLICALPFLLTRHGSIDFTGTGEIGDTIGGTMSPFVAIVAAILTFLAFWVQYVANQQQRQDIALERFENRLFQMIAVHEEITNNLRITASSHNGTDEDIIGRQVFEYIYLKRNHKWHSGLRGTIEAEGIDGIKDDNSLWCLDHYFRHLYRIFKMIDDSTVLKNLTQKYEYSSIARSSLSEFELVMLYYNTLGHRNYDNFKTLIERYAIFNNLRIEHLALDKEIKYYKAILSGDSSHLQDLEEPTKKFSKSAFNFNDGNESDDR